MRLQNFNEHAAWQKDIREINDILNIVARDDDHIRIDSLISEVSRDIPYYRVSFVRQKENFTEDGKVRWNEVLKDTPRFEFCNKVQEIVDRIRALGHEVDVFLSYWDPSKGDDVDDWWCKNIPIANPIDFAYHTHIYIIWINIEISDPKPPKPPKAKKWWHFK